MHLGLGWGLIPFFSQSHKQPRGCGRGQTRLIKWPVSKYRVFSPGCYLDPAPVPLQPPPAGEGMISPLPSPHSTSQPLTPRSLELQSNPLNLSVLYCDAPGSWHLVPIECNTSYTPPISASPNACWDLNSPDPILAKPCHEA